MKQSVFIVVLLAAAFIVSAVIYFYALPKFIQDGGYLVIALIALSIMVFTFTVERTLSLRKAQGRGSIPKFLRQVELAVEDGKFDEAAVLCENQQGSLASILKAGFLRYLELQKRKKPLPNDKLVADMQRTFEEATSLEMASSKVRCMKKTSSPFPRSLQWPPWSACWGPSSG